MRRARKLVGTRADLRASVKELEALLKEERVKATARDLLWVEACDRATRAEARVAELEASLGATIEMSTREALDRIYRHGDREQELAERIAHAEARVEKLRDALERITSYDYCEADTARAIAKAALAECGEGK